MPEPKRTEYGFKWGAADVQCAARDNRKGWVVVELKTPKHPRGIQLYVTKTGKVRVHDGAAEWLPAKKEQA